MEPQKTIFGKGRSSEERKNGERSGRYLFKLHFNMLSQEATKKFPIGMISYRGH